MAELKRGEAATCSACGRKVLVEEGGTSSTTIWCCGEPMVPTEKNSEQSSGSMDRKETISNE